MSASPSLVTKRFPTSATHAVARPLDLRKDAAREERRRLHELRIQIALVRTLLDELELCARQASDTNAAREQIIEEMFRLSCQTLETASGFAPLAEELEAETSP